MAVEIAEMGVEIAKTRCEMGMGLRNGGCEMGVGTVICQNTILNSNQ